MEEDPLATNLVSLNMRFLTPDMVGRIASALGLDRNNTQTAIRVAVPGLLAELSRVAAQPGGAQKLVDTVRQQTGALDSSFGNMIGASGQFSSIEGSQFLSSLLGGREQTALADAVGKYAGLGQSASGSLLGMLALVVMGTISKEQGTRSLDAGGIASLLASQKDNIEAALPSDFYYLLGGTGLLDSLGGVARTATAAAGQTASVSTSAARAFGDMTPRAADWFDWARYLHPAVLLAISFVAAATVFLTGAELRAVSADMSAIIKLLAGAALLYVVGIFFTQQLTSRRTWREARDVLERNTSDLDRMKRALPEAHKP